MHISGRLPSLLSRTSEFPLLLPQLAMKSDSVTSDSIEGVGLKAVGDDPASGMSDPSSSGANLTENPLNGSENPANLSTVYAALQKQGERTDRILDLFQNQAKTLGQHGKWMKAQAAALNTQGNALKRQGNILKEHKATLNDQSQKLNMHSMVISGLFQSQQNLLAAVESVKKDISILKQNETKLKVIQGRSEDKFGELDLKTLGSNRILPVPFNLSTNEWNGIVAASFYPVRPYNIMQQNAQPLFKDSENLQ